MRKKILIAAAITVVVFTSIAFIFEYTGMPEDVISTSYPVDADNDEMPEDVILKLYQDYNPHIAENSLVSFKTNKAVYSHGEPIHISVHNRSPYILTSSSSNYGIYVTTIKTQPGENCGMYGSLSDMYGMGDMLTHIYPNTTFSSTFQPLSECKKVQVCHNMQTDAQFEKNIPHLLTFLCVNANISPPP